MPEIRYLRLDPVKQVLRLASLSLAEAFDTTPQLWLNLQQTYDLWIEDHVHKRVEPIVRNGVDSPSAQHGNDQIFSC